MKKLMLIAIMMAYSLIADDLDKLEQSYFSKAEGLQAERDKDVKKRDDKLAKDSKRLAMIYFMALKNLEISIVKKGDLDGALKVRAKIKEIEAILKGEEVAAAKLKPKIVIPPNNIIKEVFPGSLYNRIYHWSTTMRCHFAKDGVFMAGNKRGSFKRYGSWIYDNGFIIIKYSKGRSQTYKFADDLSYYQHIANGTPAVKKIPFLGLVKVNP